MIRKSSQKMHPADREYIEQQEEKIMQIRERLAHCEDTSERNILRLRLKTCGENIMRLLCGQKGGYSCLTYTCREDAYSKELEELTGARRVDVISPEVLDMTNQGFRDGRKVRKL